MDSLDVQPETPWLWLESHVRGDQDASYGRGVITKSIQEDPGEKSETGPGQTGLYSLLLAGAGTEAAQMLSKLT